MANPASHELPELVMASRMQDARVKSWSRRHPLVGERPGGVTTAISLSAALPKRDVQLARALGAGTEGRGEPVVGSARRAVRECNARGGPGNQRQFKHLTLNITRAGLTRIDAELSP
jgi:hypothetical protein